MKQVIDGVRAALDEMAQEKEGNAFTKALMAARKAGDETFTVAGKTYKCEDYDEEGNVKEAMDPVDPKAAKKDFKDRKDKDIDNDGDVDDSDEYLHKKRKAIAKSKSKNEDEPEGDKGETAKMNPKTETKESVEMQESKSIRDRLMSIWEDAADLNEADRAAHYKGATKQQPHANEDEDQKMRDGHKDVKREPHMDDSSKAERSGPSTQYRGNDNKAGDKKIINKIANAYKTMGDKDA